MRRAAVAAVLLLALGGCRNRYYIHGYNDGIADCNKELKKLEPLLEATKKRVDDLKSKCDADRAELETCRQSIINGD